MKFDLDAKPRKLITTNNPKINKGEKLGYLAAALHLSPARSAGVGEICPFRSAGCTAGCLNTAGHAGIALDCDGLNFVQVARIQRTRLWKNNRRQFNKDLHREITNHIKRAKRLGMTPAIRLNGTSDIPWEKFKFCGYKNVFAAFPDVQFYDYTKWPIEKRGTIPPNYDLTFSLCEDNDELAAEALDNGISVAVVFDVAKSKPFPNEWILGDRKVRIIDGDETDARFVDSPASIIGLRAKGRAKNDDTGFVRQLS